MNITSTIIPLSESEQKALTELAQLDDMSEENVMRRALRIYQMIRKGSATLVLPPPFELKLAMPLDREPTP